MSVCQSYGLVDSVVSQPLLILFKFVLEIVQYFHLNLFNPSSFERGYEFYGVRVKP